MKPVKEFQDLEVGKLYVLQVPVIRGITRIGPGPAHEFIPCFENLGALKFDEYVVLLEIGSVNDLGCYRAKILTKDGIVGWINSWCDEWAKAGL